MSDIDPFESKSSTPPSSGSGSRRQRGKILPRIASFLQSLRDSESDTQRHVDEMDKAGPSTVHFYLKANMSPSA